MTVNKLERRNIGPEGGVLAPLSIPRIVTGLWQIADQERESGQFDLDKAALDLRAYAADGFDAFDMADHYGSAELVAGRAFAAREPRPVLMTKWVPEPGDISKEQVRAAIERSIERLGAQRLDLLQFHWWSYTHPGYIDALSELMRLREEGLIGHLGLTNFDTAHLRLLVKHGIEIATNQVCFSLLDRRASREMSAFCQEHDIGILAFGTLCGGYLSDRWLGAQDQAVDDWSKMKYRRFIDAIGGWQRFQDLLEALDGIAKKTRGLDFKCRQPLGP